MEEDYIALDLERSLGIDRRPDSKEVNTPFLELYVGFYKMRYSASGASLVDRHTEAIIEIELTARLKKAARYGAAIILHEVVNQMARSTVRFEGVTINAAEDVISLDQDRSWSVWIRLHSDTYDFRKSYAFNITQKTIEEAMVQMMRTDCLDEENLENTLNTLVVNAFKPLVGEIAEEAVRRLPQQFRRIAVDENYLREGIRSTDNIL